MFHQCRLLSSLDLRNFDTKSVTNMAYMFEECGNLKRLDVTSFHTDKVTKMNSIFEGCKSLTSLDIRDFNTENVGLMGSMFKDCRSLVKLDVSNINKFEVTNEGKEVAIIALGDFYSKGVEYPINNLSIKKISAEIPKGAIRLNLKAKVYAAGIGDMNDLLENPISAGNLQDVIK